MAKLINLLLPAFALLLSSITFALEPQGPIWYHSGDSGPPPHPCQAKDKTTRDIVINGAGEECLTGGDHCNLGEVFVSQCYNNGYGVDRDHLVSVIDATCTAINDYAFGENNLRVFTFRYYYAAREGTEEEGRVLLKALYYPSSTICDFMYPGGFHVQGGVCKGAFLATVDSCNTATENNKHGGVGTDPCLMYLVDPNPSINNANSSMPPNTIPDDSASTYVVVASTFVGPATGSLAAGAIGGSAPNKEVVDYPVLVTTTSPPDAPPTATLMASTFHG